MSTIAPPAARYRDVLPQLGDDVFLTDGGLETTMIFHEGLDLPDFAAFTLVDDPAGRATLVHDYGRYAEVAVRQGVGLVAETATWRASQDWGDRLGYDEADLARANREAVAVLEEVRARHETSDTPVVISGSIGPRGDGYDPGDAMTAEEAEAYHSAQVGVFAETAADLVSAITMTNVPEAIGVTRAAVAAGIPVVISFTTETDGLPEGVEAVDAATGAAPAYYMVNCAHPTHFATALDPGQEWTRRVRGIRANASTMSHEELDEAPDLDRGDPADLADRFRGIRSDHGQITVLGGCCGTDHVHIAAIAAACTGGA